MYQYRQNNVYYSHMIPGWEHSNLVKLLEWLTRTAE